MTRHRAPARLPALLLATVATLALTACGSSGLSTEEWTWCSNVDHMAREVGDEARSMGLVAPDNADGITDDAVYWATYYYRTGKVKDLRSQPDFIKACAAAYNANPH
jgi:hypothetical protein